jgi:Uma2 family endonuclease
MSTNTAVHTSPLSDPIQSLALYRFTVDEYERMAPVLDDPRVELVDGYVVRKMGKKPPHIWSVGRIFKTLDFLRTDRWTCRKDDPIRIPDFDEPEPDIAVIRGPDVDYQDRMPQAADVALVVEVAESTLERDQGLKLTAYARGGIPTYWIVNLIERKIQVYSGPTAVGYDTRTDFVAGEEVPVILDGVDVGKIAVDSILPKQVSTD